MPPLIRKIEPGDVIGRCRAIRELGRGGVGTVYLATHQTLQIEVALKVLSPSLSLDNPALAERFIREAQLAARIRHPNVIAVMDAAQDETTGLYYIVMEYVGGGSLSWHLRNGPLPEAKALGIVTGIAHALVIAEESRIVHRDIKPENIMLDLRGTAKLADLGLAKHSLDSQISLTLGGTFMGTPAYMSPEQARDAKIADTRDDIYSLGASFYECLTGQAPFQGETPYNIMSELLTKPSPKPHVLRPEVSRSADMICRKMMAKTRDLRYADARALLRDLQHAQVYGDAGFDGLEAASFDRDAVEARREASHFGVDTSLDGVYAMPDPPPLTKNPPVLPPPLLAAPRRADYGVFWAAALLIALVTGATLLLAWAGPNHPFSSLEKEFALLTGEDNATPPAKVTKHAADGLGRPEKSSASAGQPPRATSPQVPPVDVAPVIPLDSGTTPVQPSGLTPPVALPVNPGELNPADTAGLTHAPVAIPATPVAPDSAFVARSVAEGSLDISNMPTGHAELLKVIGKRDEDQAMPTTWTFYFFDKNADGNARIITVNGGKTVKSGEDLVHIAAPFSERDVLPEDKLLIDSTQAMQIAQNLIPGVPIVSSEFTLMQQKNSVPMWKIALWTRDSDGESRRIGDVTLLAENGTPISKDLKP